MIETLITLGIVVIFLSGTYAANSRVWSLLRASLESKKSRDVYLNTGADLGSLTLNGKLLWKNEGWTGWHAGKERIPARLAAGTNTLEIECGSSFFLSITGENNW